MERITHIHVTRLEQPVDFDPLHAQPMSPFNFSWNAASIPHAARYALFLTNHSLIATFSSPIPAWTTRHDNQGDFVSGLWEFDLGEIFISDPKSGRYQEFNLAPSGAWWTCLFSSYRKAEERQPQVAPLSTWQRSAVDGWNAAIEIPFSEIQLPFSDVSELRFNVCGIEGNSPRHYLSAATIETSEPDFHFSASYLPLQD